MTKNKDYHYRKMHRAIMEDTQVVKTDDRMTRAEMERTLGLSQPPVSRYVE